MNWLLTGLAGVGFVELILRMPVVGAVVRVRDIYASAFRVITSKAISDHWKEKVLPKYAFILFGLTFRLAGYFALAALPVMIVLILSRMFDLGVLDFLLSAVGILYVSVVSAVYVLARRLVAKKRL